MTNKNISSVVFFDVDGVPNTLNTYANAQSKVHMGIDEAQNCVLANATKEKCTDGKVNNGDRRLGYTSRNLLNEEQKNVEVGDI